MRTDTRPTAHATFAVLDALRGIAAGLVMTRHSQEFWGGLHFFQSYLAVDLFFVLSGFVICNAYGRRLTNGELSISAFMKIRIIRFYPIYCLAACVGFAAQPIWDLRALGSLLLTLVFIPSPLQSGTHALFPTNGPFWSLFFELVMNLALAVFLARGFRRYLPALISLLALPLIWIAGSKEGLDTGFTWVSSPAGAAIAGFGIFLGYWLCDATATFPTLSRWTLLPIIGVTSGLLVMPSIFPYNSVFALSCALLVLPLLVAASAKIAVPAWLKTPFGWLGEVSYPLYAFHAPIAVLVGGWLGDSLPRGTIWPGVALLVGLCGLSTLVSRLLDRPLRRRMTHWMSRPALPLPTGPARSSAKVTRP